MIMMNLIEKLGLEKCKQIVDGANGITATHYQNGDYLEKWLSTSWVRFVGDQLIDVAIPSTKNLISIADLRTAIANHEKCQHEWNETTSNGDAYRFFVCKHCDSTQNYVPFEADHCTDIKNHISPNTKVIEG